MVGINICDPIKSILNGQKLNVLSAIDKVDVYGANFNCYWRRLETVIRGEIALYKNVPKMAPGSVRDMIEGMGSQVFLPSPFAITKVGDIFAFIPLGDLEGEVLPYSSGQIRTFDVWNYGLGFDSFMTVPYLNREEFVFLLEYAGSKIVDDLPETILLPWKSPNGDPIYETEFRNTFVFIATTNYLNGMLAPRLVVKYEWQALEFEISCFHTISDTYEGQFGHAGDAQRIIIPLYIELLPEFCIKYRNEASKAPVYRSVGAILTQNRITHTEQA